MSERLVASPLDQLEPLTEEERLAGFADPGDALPQNPTERLSSASSNEAESPLVGSTEAGDTGIRQTDARILEESAAVYRGIEDASTETLTLWQRMVTATGNMAATAQKTVMQWAYDRAQAGLRRRDECLSSADAEELRGQRQAAGAGATESQDQRKERLDEGDQPRPEVTAAERADTTLGYITNKEADELIAAALPSEASNPERQNEGQPMGGVEGLGEYAQNIAKADQAIAELDKVLPDTQFRVTQLTEAWLRIPDPKNPVHDPFFKKFGEAERQLNAYKERREHWRTVANRNRSEARRAIRLAHLSNPDTQAGQPVQGARRG